MLDLSFVFSQNTRTDDYVNATNWCKAFGKDLNEFIRNKKTKEFVKALENKGLLTTENSRCQQAVSKERVGKTWETWVHPLLAIKLAEWLSPEFDVFVKQTFRRYLQADESLAKDILTRAQGKEQRKAFASELQKRGAKQYTFAAATNAIYRPLFGMDAQELKETLETNITRDKLGRTELAAILLAESMAVDEMEDTDAKGHQALVSCSKLAGEKVARVFD